MSFCAADLHAALIAITPATASGYVVALSGGADSAALLAAAAQLASAAQLPAALPLRAVHVDHGLQAAAAALRDHCRDLCRSLSVPLSVVAVEVAQLPGDSLEAAARAARYAALAAALEPRECLITAQHAEDQAETLLLQALRGTGIDGLSSMPACRKLDGGWHLRPLLEVQQRDLLAFGVGAAAPGVADPMNQDLRFDRVYLRRRVWPEILARWPGAASSLTRTARHAAEAQALLQAAADADVERLRDGEALSVPALRALPLPRRVAAVRAWLRQAGAQPPPAARLREALRQVFEAEADHAPAMFWGAHALRRYRQRLFLTAAQAPRLDAALHWQIAAGLHLPLGDGLGTLRWSAQRGALDAQRIAALGAPGLEVRARRGGETLQAARAARTHSVQQLCQERGVLPWLRDALPLVFVGDELLAVGDLWANARWCAAADAPGLALEWLDAPIVV